MGRRNNINDFKDVYRRIIMLLKRFINSNQKFILFFFLLGIIFCGCGQLSVNAEEVKDKKLKHFNLLDDRDDSKIDDLLISRMQLNEFWNRFYNYISLQRQVNLTQLLPLGGKGEVPAVEDAFGRSNINIKFPEKVKTLTVNFNSEVNDRKVIDDLLKSFRDQKFFNRVIDRAYNPNLTPMLFELRMVQPNFKIKISDSELADCWRRLKNNTLYIYNWNNTGKADPKSIAKKSKLLSLFGFIFAKIDIEDIESLKIADVKSNVLNRKAIVLSFNAPIKKAFEFTRQISEEGRTFLFFNEGMIMTPSKKNAALLTSAVSPYPNFKILVSFPYLSAEKFYSNNF